MMKALFRAFMGVMFFGFLIIGAYGLGGGYAAMLAIGILGMCAVSLDSIYAVS
jgi:hypothetical protein